MPKKRAKRRSLTSRTLERLRKEGCTVDVCERWITIPNHPGGGQRKDLFGLFDIVAIREGAIFGIQSTGHTNRSEHLKKMLAEPRLTEWLRAGGRAELWAWKKDANGRWEPRKQTLSLKPIDVKPITLAEAARDWPITNANKCPECKGCGLIPFLAGTMPCPKCKSANTTGTPT